MIYIIWILYGISAIIIVLYYERVLRETRDEYKEKIMELNKQLAAKYANEAAPPEAK